MSLGVELHLKDVKLTLGFVVLLAKTVHFLLLGIKFNSVAALNVLLNFHAHDVCVDWQGHLVGHRVDLALFLLDCPPHVVQPLLDGQLELLLGLDLLREAFLELVGLGAHLFVVAFEVRVERIDLFFLGKSCLQMALHCCQGTLQVLVFLPKLVEDIALDWDGSSRVGHSIR